jgi:hypothetical protein
VYVVDGTIPEPDSPTGHGPPSERPSSLERIAQRLAADQPAALLHEVDPHLSRSAPLAAAATLGELDAAAHTVQATIVAGPADVTRQLSDAEHRHTSLLARRRITADRLIEAESRRGPRVGAAAGDPAGRHAREIDRYRRVLEAIDRQLELTAHRISESRGAAAARARFVDATAPDRSAADILRDAATLREATLRLGAPTLAAHPNLVPPEEPSRRQERAAHRHALEAVALYRDRFGVPSLAGAEPAPLADSAAAAIDLAAVLGPRPEAPAARRAWDRAAAAVQALARTTPSTNPTGAEPSAGIQP